MQEKAYYGLEINNQIRDIELQLAYVDGNTQLTAEGIAEGVISRSAVGDNGFGYDPIFFIPEEKKTFAQMDMDRKEIFSHRGKAVKAILKVLSCSLDEFNELKKKEIA